MRSASGLCSQLAASFLCMFLPACVGKHQCQCGRSALCIEISMESSCGVLVHSIMCMSAACCDFGCRWKKRCYAAEPTLPRCVELCWCPCWVLDIYLPLSTTGCLLCSISRSRWHNCITVWAPSSVESVCCWHVNGHATRRMPRIYDQTRKRKDEQLQLLCQQARRAPRSLVLGAEDSTPPSPA